MSFCSRAARSSAPRSLVTSRPRAWLGGSARIRDARSPHRIHLIALNKIYGSEKGQWVPPATTTSKREVIETYRRDGKHPGSPEFQIAVLTQRIKHLTEPLRAARHDNSSRRG